MRKGVENSDEIGVVVTNFWAVDLKYMQETAERYPPHTCYVVVSLSI